MAEIQLLRVPKWGLSMEEGTIALWLIEEGDDFAEGQEVCEIETSKIANVMEAPFAGRLHRIVAHPGDTLPVQAVIAVVAPAGVDESEIEAVLAAEGSVDALSDEDKSTYRLPLEPAAETATGDASQSVAARADVGELSIPESLKGVTSDDVFASPRAYRFAVAQGLDLSYVVGTGRAGRISMSDIRSAVRTAGGTLPSPPSAPCATALPASNVDDEEIEATPVARRLAKAWGIALAACRPTGRHGRVCKADVEAARSRAGAPEPERGNAQKAAAAPKEAAAPANPGIAVPMTGMRRTIAARLSQSKLDSPHFRVAVDVQVDAIAALRKQINAEHPGVKISVNDFVIKAVAMALVRHPNCNIQFDGDVIQQFEHADVSVAVAMEAGLITPILRAADTKSLVAISTEMRQLATKAKASTLTPEEFQGGTFTISNLGMFGVSQFDAIINPPQAAILAVGGAREEVRFVGGEPAPITLMNLNMASDHRVIDGALAAEFLQSVKRNLESPIVMLAGEV
ncbi:MAG: 2-oxo acid dehydrogenase subunit E2 [Pseudomonadota bacterium]